MNNFNQFTSLMAAFLLTVSAAAQPLSWDGSTFDWTDPSNWNPVGIPGPTTPVLFETVGVKQVELGLDQTVFSILFDGAAGYSLDLTAGPGTNTLTLQDGGLTIVGGGSHLINSNIQLGNAGVWTLNGDMEIAGSLFGAFGINLGGPGQLTLTGDNAGYSQDISVDQATLVLTAPGAISQDTGIGLQNLATLVLNSNQSVGQVSGDGTINLNNSNLTTGWNNQSAQLSGLIDGFGDLTKVGSGRLTLSGDAVYIGDTIITQGELQIGDGGTTGSISGNILNESELIFNRSDAFAYAGSISGGGALTLSGPNGHGGTTSIEGGEDRPGPRQRIANQHRRHRAQRRLGCHDE